MEALSAAQDDSSGANPSSVKSDDSSPQRDSGAGSPPPNCAICLGTCKNKSFTDSCLHQFCFSCLLTWSKVKAECPLCKQAFRSIIHNVRSNHQYEEYLVVQRQTEESSSRIEIDHVTAATQRFRYRTTLTLPRRETYAIQELLRHYPFMADVLMRPMQPVARRRRSPASFRRTVYRHNLWARPLPDFTGRFRDCSPEFYRYNDTQMHRLVPWLNRELHYLLNENVGHISYVMTRILELLSQHHINSLEFREAMNRYFGDRTEHFLHELFCFASTPYDMTGYDRNVQYTTMSSMVNEVVSSSESEMSADSDVVLVSSSYPDDAPAGPSNSAGRAQPRGTPHGAWRGPAPRPSRRPPPVYPDATIAYDTDVPSVIPIEAVVPIETISHSDTDDDSSEVMVVGYIKPPQERTPEIVDLLGSDSDVIVQESTAPEAEGRAVKLTLKQQRVRSRSGSSRDADTWARGASPERFPAWRPSSTSSASSTATSTSPSPTSTSPTPTSIDTDSSPVVKKKSKKSKRQRGVSSRRDRKSKKRSSRSHHREKRVSAERDKRAKRKSHSGKGVKSSKRCTNRIPESMEPVAGPSGTGATAAETSGAGVSGVFGDDAYASGPSGNSAYSSSAYTSGSFGNGAHTSGTSSSSAYIDDASGNDAYTGGTFGTSAYTSGASGSSAYASGASGSSAYTNGVSGSDAYAGGACGSSPHAGGACGSGTSGGSTSTRVRSRSADSELRRRTKERKRRRRDTRDTKRLRSVVNVMYHRHAEESNSSANPTCYANVNPADEADATAETRESRRERTKSSRSPAPSYTWNSDDDGSTDSEDNLPLNLTLHRMNMPT